MSVFLATMIGAALGVVAGAVIQFLVQQWLDRAEFKRQLDDIRAEAVYNISAVNELIAEAGRLRALAHPGGIQNYLGIFPFANVLWIAMNRIVNSGRLYRTFSHAEIEKIQKTMVFLSGATGSWVTTRVNQVKTAGDFQDAINLASYIEQTCRQHMDTILLLRDKQVT